MLTRLTAILLIAAPFAISQSTRPLSGRVVDATGQGIGGVAVEAVPFKGDKLATVTAADGTYTFDGLIPGRYLVNVRKSDFEGAILFTEIIAGETARLNTTLRQFGPGEPQRVRVGGNVQARNLTTKVQPAYPREAKQQGIQGTVALNVVISREGKPDMITLVSSPDPSLTAASVEAVRQWEWRPTLLNGNPVEVMTRVDVNFTLSQ